VKVDCEHIEGVEADLMDCPTLFGMGDPQKAVDKVNIILDEAESAMSCRNATGSSVGCIKKS
jgi:hypothetical protein